MWRKSRATITVRPEEWNELVSQASSGMAAISCIASEIRVQKMLMSRGQPMDFSVLDKHIQKAYARLDISYG